MTFESLFYLTIAAICTWYPLSLYMLGGGQQSLATSGLRYQHYRHAAVSVLLAHVFMGTFLFDMTVGISRTVDGVKTSRHLSESRSIAVIVAPVKGRHDISEVNSYGRKP